MHVDDLKAFHGSDVPMAWLPTSGVGKVEVGTQCDAPPIGFKDSDMEIGRQDDSGEGLGGLSSPSILQSPDHAPDPKGISGDGEIYQPLQRDVGLQNRPKRTIRPPKRFGWD